MNNFKSAEVWSPCEQLQQPNTLNYGIMVLNTPITTVCNPLVIHSLWNQGILNNDWIYFVKVLIKCI